MAPSVCSSASSDRAREVKVRADSAWIKTTATRGGDDHLTRLPSPRGLHRAIQPSPSQPPPPSLLPATASLTASLIVFSNFPFFTQPPPNPNLNPDRGTQPIDLLLRRRTTSHCQCLQGPGDGITGGGVFHLLHFRGDHLHLEDHIRHTKWTLNIGYRKIKDIISYPILKSANESQPKTRNRNPIFKTYHFKTLKRSSKRTHVEIPKHSLPLTNWVIPKMENQPQTHWNRRRGEPELEELEEEVKKMTQKLRHYISTLPSQFSDVASSILAAQRPLLGFLDLDSVPGSNEYKKGGFHADGNEGIP